MQYKLFLLYTTCYYDNTNIYTVHRNISCTDVQIAQVRGCVREFEAMNSSTLSHKATHSVAYSPLDVGRFNPENPLVVSIGICDIATYKINDSSKL